MHAPVRTCVEPGSAVRERVELKFFYGLKGQRKENARSGTAASHKEIMLHMLPGTASVYKMRLRADPHRSQITHATRELEASASLARHHPRHYY